MVIAPSPRDGKGRKVPGTDYSLLATIIRSKRPSTKHSAFQGSGQRDVRRQPSGGGVYIRTVSGQLADGTWWIMPPDRAR